jgi:hypothetical protein
VENQSSEGRWLAALGKENTFHAELLMLVTLISDVSEIWQFLSYPAAADRRSERAWAPDK